MQYSFTAKQAVTCHIVIGLCHTVTGLCSLPDGTQSRVIELHVSMFGFQAFNKPEVQQAIMDIQSNPMNMLKYQQNPEVMSVSASFCSCLSQLYH